MGYSYNAIAGHLQMPMSTLFYYVKMLNEDDKKLLANLKDKMLDHEIIICKSRLERTLLRCEEISLDSTTLPKEKLEAEKLKSQISIDILRLVRDSDINGNVSRQIQQADTDEEIATREFFNSIA